MVILEIFAFSEQSILIQRRSYYNLRLNLCEFSHCFNLPQLQVLPTTEEETSYCESFDNLVEAEKTSSLHILEVVDDPFRIGTTLFFPFVLGCINEQTTILDEIKCLFLSKV